MTIEEMFWWYSGLGLNVGLLMYLFGWGIGRMVGAYREYMK